MSKFGSFLTETFKVLGEVAEASLQAREEEKKKLFLYTKKEFDQVMNTNIENEEAFKEGCRIMGNYNSYYTKDTFMQNMQDYIKKYKTGKEEPTRSTYSKVEPAEAKKETTKDMFSYTYTELEAMSLDKLKEEVYSVYTENRSNYTSTLAKQARELYFGEFKYSSKERYKAAMIKFLLETGKA